MQSIAEENLLETEHKIKIETKKKQPEESEDSGDEEEATCTCNEASYGIADAVFTSCIVAPLVVTVWRSTWNIMDMYSPGFPHAQQYLLGIIIHVCFALLRFHLLSRSTGAWRRSHNPFLWLRERALSKLYTYVFAVACIMHWQGGWGLLDRLVASVVPGDDDPHRPVAYAVIIIVLYIIISSLRSSRNLLAPPYFLFTDGKEVTYMFTTRFQAKSSKQSVLFILDCIFSVGVVGSLVVFVWRGSWALLDIFLYPGNQATSCWISLMLGYVLVVLTFGLQAPVRWAAARLHGTPRLLLADVYHLVSFVATVNVWRGVWGLLDVYFFPDSPKLSNWCSHIVSLTLLILLNCANSVLVRGVYIDAEEPAGECVVFPCHYLRLYFHKERIKKRHKRALATAAKLPDESNLPLQQPEEKV